MKVYVLICPETGKYLKNTMARYSDKYELTGDVEESFYNGDHSILVALKNSNEFIKDFRLAIRDIDDKIDEVKKQRLLNTVFQGRGRLGTHKRRLISKGR